MLDLGEEEQLKMVDTPAPGRAIARDGHLQVADMPFRKPNAGYGPLLRRIQSSIKGQARKISTCTKASPAISGSK